MSIDLVVGLQSFAALTGADRFNGLSAATVCVWYKGNGGPGGADDNVFGLETGTSLGMGCRVDTTTPANTLVGQIVGSTSFDTFTHPRDMAAIGQTDWHFLALSYEDGVSAFFMVDGEVILADGSGPVGTVDALDHQINLGFVFSSTFKAPGYYQHLMSFQQALTAEELRALRWNPEAFVGAGFNNINHLVGYDDKIDTGDHANAVTWQNALTFETGSISGISPALVAGNTNSHDFNGSTDRLFIDVTSDPLAARTTHTTMCWFNDDSGIIDATMIGTDNGSGTFGPLLDVQNSSQTPLFTRGFFRNTAFASLTLSNGGSGAGASGAWHHLAMTTDLGVTDGCKLFLDGVQVDQGTLAVQGGILSNDEIVFGDRALAETGQFDGKMAYCAGVKAVMSEAEIAEAMHRPESLLARSDLHFMIMLDHRRYRDVGPSAFDVQISTTEPTPFAGGPPTEFDNGGVVAFLQPAASAPHNADGILDISMGITATGSNPNRRADGILDISMGVVGAGSNPNRRANGNLGGMFFLISASGGNSARHGDGLQNISIALAATGSAISIHGDGAPGGMNLQLAGSGISVSITGSAVLPSLETNGQMHQGPIYQGDMRLPRLRVEGLLDNPQGGVGRPRLPQLQVQGTLQGPAIVVLPSLAVDATGFAGTLATGCALLPLLQTTGVLFNPLFATGDPRLPGLRVVGVGVSGTAVSNTVTLPGLQVVAAGSGENIITGDLTLPMIRLDPASGVAAAGSIGGNSVILPALLVEGLLVNAVVLGTTAWSMNTETFKTTNYINFDFVDLVSFGGQPYGVTAAGIFLLEGADDDGTDIDARFLTGIEDLNNENIKELSRLYMEYIASGALRVNLWPDGQTRVRNYDIERVSNTTTTGVKHARFKGARGLRSRSFQLGVQNLSGGDFDIDKLGILLRVLSRKTRKH